MRTISILFFILACGERIPKENFVNSSEFYFVSDSLINDELNILWTESREIFDSLHYMNNNFFYINVAVFSAFYDDEFYSIKFSSKLNDAILNIRVGQTNDITTRNLEIGEAYTIGLIQAWEELDFNKLRNDVFCEGADGTIYFIEFRGNEESKVIFRWSPETCNFSDFQNFMYFVNNIRSMR
jgi:hypothetical protein